MYGAASQCGGFVLRASKYVLFFFFPVFADGAHFYVFYLYPYFSTDCLTSQSSLRCLLINVALTVDVYECCLIVPYTAIPSCLSMCRLAPMETHTKTMETSKFIRYSLKNI